MRRHGHCSPNGDPQRAHEHHHDYCRDRAQDQQKVEITQFSLTRDHDIGRITDQRRGPANVRRKRLCHQKTTGLSSKRLVMASVTGAMSKTVVTLSSIAESAAVNSASNTNRRNGFASARCAAQIAKTSKRPVSRTMFTITIIPISRNTTL